MDGFDNILSTDCRLDFWHRYWRSRIVDLRDLDEYEIQLDNPHFLLREIVAEIIHNNLGQKDNKKLFLQQLGKVKKLDSVFAALYGAEISLVLKNWDTSPLIVKNICDSILLSMDKYNYLHGIIDKLKSILECKKSFDENEKDKICLHTDLLIQEFICLGVDIDDISTFIENDNVAIGINGEVIACEDSFYELKRDEYESVEEFHEAVSLRYKSRTAKDYIDNILVHFHKEAQEGYVILRLLGVKGSIDYHFKDIHLYSIDKASYLPANSPCDIEKPESTPFVNVAVKVKYRYPQTTLKEAVQKVNALLEYLSFNVRSKEGLSISRQFSAIVVDGRVINSNFSMKDNLECMHLYRELTAIDLSSYRNDLNDWLEEFSDNDDLANETFQKISNSTHWHSKAVCADKNEDRLLYSWIALESILKASDSILRNIQPKDCNMLNVAKTLCSGLMAKHKFYSYANKVYHDLLTSVSLGNFYRFKKETIESAKLNLKEGDIIDLSYFFEGLPALIDEIIDEIYKRELMKVQSFYKDESKIIGFRNSVCNDLTLIYRLRNMIVHNAICPQFIIKLYAYKAQYISGVLIQTIRQYYNTHEADINDALLGIYLECQIFENNISEHIRNIKKSHTVSQTNN